MAHEEAKLDRGVQLEVLVTAWQANDAVKFYEKALGATEIKRLYPPLRIGHDRFLFSILKLGDTTLRVSYDSTSMLGYLWSEFISYLAWILQLLFFGTNNTTRVICVPTDEDVDVAIYKAIRAGAKADNSSKYEKRVKDPYGIVWSFFNDHEEE